MRNDFSTARLVIVILEIVGWLTVIVAFLLLLGSSRDQFGNISWVRVGVWLGVVAAGILQVASAQVVKAVVVTAENSERMVEILSNLSRGQTSSPADPPLTYASLRAGGTSSPRPPDAIKSYKGRWILKSAEGIKVDGNDRVFSNVIEAERFIDGRG